MKADFKLGMAAHAETEAGGLPVPDHHELQPSLCYKGNVVGFRCQLIRSEDTYTGSWVPEGGVASSVQERLLGSAEPHLFFPS